MKAQKREKVSVQLGDFHENANETTNSSVWATDFGQRSSYASYMANPLRKNLNCERAIKTHMCSMPQVE
uniref:HDC15545 n=1 Tax=Drosophila melanogaster TaxID=7227 RepID=Q6IJ98_DROME|nr:TPA_inf: HDC15545 [Drosophila melanogaster]